MNDTSADLIVGIGEVLWDMLPDGEKIGGAPANFTYSITRFGLPGLAVSAIGDDKLGHRTVKALDEKGVKAFLARVPFPTGTVDVSLDAQGVPLYDIKQPAAWDFIPADERIAEIASRTRAACFGTLAQRCEVSRAAINLFLDSMPEGSLKVFDINLRQNFYSKDVIEASLRRADILKINNEELVVVSRLLGYPGLHLEDTCRQLMEDWQLGYVALTCGENGSYIFAPDAMSFVPTPEVKVADTVGAGDSFTAAFIAALLSGMTLNKAHELATEAAAFVCTCHGAMADYPEKILSRLGK